MFGSLLSRALPQRQLSTFQASSGGCRPRLLLLWLPGGPHVDMLSRLVLSRGQMKVQTGPVGTRLRSRASGLHPSEGPLGTPPPPAVPD